MDISQKERFMRRCFQLAKKGWRTSSFNPIVGAVLVYENQIIGEGYHEIFGEAHAEVNCISSVRLKDKDKIEKSSLFVSLEPCSYTGKTPACSSLIILHKIKHVLISCVDPNPRVSGTGIELLREQEITVETGLLEKEGLTLLRKFHVNMLHKRPFVALKWAQSKYGYSGFQNEKVWYTNAYSKVLAHRLRSEFEAILIGTNTVRIDEPSLDNRLYLGSSPIKIIIDRNAILSPTLKTFGGSQKIYIITCQENYTLPNTNCSLIYIASDCYSIRTILDRLYQENISSVLVEGGPTLQKSFIKALLWDEAHVLSSKHPQSDGIKAPSVEGKRLYSVSLHDDHYDHILA